MDRLDLYELCVQSPRHVVTLLRAIHGNDPVSMREDFSGTAAIARRWCEEGIKRGERAHALAIDLDPVVIARAVEHAHAANLGDSFRAIAGECAGKEAPASDEPADVVFAGNFSIGYLHRRSTLMGYLKRSLTRLKKGLAGPGIFACDTYGGAGAFSLTQTRRRHTGPRGEIVHYLWTHEAADPMSATVRNSISFEVEIDGEIVQRLPRAFVYEWRLWSIAELREAMIEVGFSSVDIYKDVDLAPNEQAEPVHDPMELGSDWIVVVGGRA